MYSLAIASTVYSGLMCFLNQWMVRRAVDYKQEMVKTFGVPLVASLFMGVAARALYEGIYLLTDSVLIAIIPAVCVAAILYFVLVLIFRGLTEEELRSFPKGYLLVKIAKKIHLFEE